MYHDKLKSYKKLKYEIIISELCRYKSMNSDELIQILKNEDSRYLLFLLLKKHNCFDYELLRKIFNNLNKNSIRCNLEKAEEKFFVNRDFREEYFEIEEFIKKII